MAMPQSTGPKNLVQSGKLIDSDLKNIGIDVLMRIWVA
jgi:hypothetical protein